MKKSLVILLMLIVLLGLPACAATDGKKVYNLSIDPSVVLNDEETQAATYKVERTNLLNYYGDFALLFLQNTSVKENKQQETEYSILTEEGNELLINPSSGIHYVASNYFFIDQVFNYRTLYSSDPLKNDTLYFANDQDLSFMPRAQAEDEVMRHIAFLFDQFTVVVAKTFVLDHQSMNAREKEKQAMGLLDPRAENGISKERWNENDDCYYFVMEVRLDNIPLLEKNRELDSLMIYGVSVEACYGAEGIRYLRVSPLYNVNSQEQSNVRIISSAKALQCVEAKYASIISTKETTVKSLNLRYLALPDNAGNTKYRLIPAWCAELQEKMTEPSGKVYYITSTIYFNAITGKEIL